MFFGVHFLASKQHREIKMLQVNLSSARFKELIGSIC